MPQQYDENEATMTGERAQLVLKRNEISAIEQLRENTATTPCAVHAALLIF